MFTPHNMSHVTCHVSLVTCHVFLDKWWRLSVEGLLSTGHTPSSFIKGSEQRKNHANCENKINLGFVWSNHLIKAESPNYNLISGSWPSESWAVQGSVCYVYKRIKALLQGGSTHKSYCTEVPPLPHLQTPIYMILFRQPCISLFLC